MIVFCTGAKGFQLCDTEDWGSYTTAENDFIAFKYFNINILQDAKLRMGTLG